MITALRRTLAVLALLVPWFGTFVLWMVVKAERKRLHRVIAEIDDLRLDKIKVTATEFYAEMRRDSLAVRIWAAIWLDVLAEHNAENYVEVTLGQDPRERVVVTVRRWLGQTPTEKLREAELRIEELERELAEADREMEMPL